MELKELPEQAIKDSDASYKRIARLTMIMDMENIREFFTEEFGEILSDVGTLITARFGNIIVEFVAGICADSSFDEFGGKAVITENIRIPYGDDECICTSSELSDYVKKIV